MRKGKLIINAMERGGSFGSNPQPSVQKEDNLTTALLNPIPGGGCKFAAPCIYRNAHRKRVSRRVSYFMTFNYYILRMFLQNLKSISSVFFDSWDLRRRDSEKIMDLQVLLIQNEKIQKTPYFR